MPGRFGLTISLTLTLMASATGRAQAQDSRAAIIEAEQAEKAKTLKPYVASGAEKALVTLQREFLGDPNGLYPLFASVYSGGGFTLGAGYRRFYGDRTHADLKGLYSAKNYKLVEVSTDSLGHAQGRLDLHARTGWLDATQVAYHGLGMNTPKDASAFGMKRATWAVTWASTRFPGRPSLPASRSKTTRSAKAPDRTRRSRRSTRPPPRRDWA